MSSRSSPPALIMRSRFTHGSTPLTTLLHSSTSQRTNSMLSYPSTAPLQSRANQLSPSTLSPNETNHDTHLQTVDHVEMVPTQNPPLPDVPDSSEESDWMLKAGLLAASSSTRFFNTIFGDSGTQQAPKSIPNQLDLSTRTNHVQNKFSRLATRRKSVHSPDFVTPSRQVADDLLKNFFDHVYIHWFDRAEFLRWYEGLWTGAVEVDDPLNDQINYALLNMTFALVYRTEPETLAEDQEQLAQVHFLRAQRLLQLDIFSFGRVNLLYTLFMFLQWYQSVNDVQKCNSLVRICIMVAQNIGLDMPERVANIRSQRQREMARRAWHGCILMDRIISMVSGQPLKIPQEQAKNTSLFQAIDDEYLTLEGPDGRQPSSEPSHQSFFLAFCQLHLILGDILIKPQNDRHEKRAYIDTNHILEVDKSLNDYSAALPAHLSFQRDREAHDMEHGKVIHLQTRFLHIRILLFRPFFLQATETFRQKDLISSGDFAHAVTLQGLLTCVTTAKEILTLLGSRLNAGIRGPHLVPQWWHTVAYVYTASTILIAAHMFPALLEKVTVQNLSECIEVGFQILDILSQQKDTAKQCRMALSMLYEKHAKHVTETPRYTPHGTMLPPESPSLRQIDGTDLSMNLDWAFLDPLDLFNSHDVGQMFSGDIYATDMNSWP